ncbi:DUF5054 domain-containing protein [Vagococcus fluvialis]|uniref:DUF5054 domain-containing protein n=1 Tax=Vagococcus fluvialis TaxID=2738 RepID=UPI003B5CF02F
MYIVYKTHLDIGFTDLAANVIDSYVEDFIPRAIELAEKVPDKFVWTTGSWLIDYYLNQADVTEDKKERLKTTLQQGGIKWHGLASTTWTELMDKTLFNYSLSLSQTLDAEFNKKTIAAKMTDIPGHTISMVPLMAQAGLKYFHIGVNASSAIPDIPEMFLWKGKDGSEIIVHYAKDYGDFFGPDDWEESLYFAHSHDNQGPPKTVEEINTLFDTLSVKYPNVELIPSSLDDFAAYAWSKKESLPVIEEEIGDSWIHGVGTDPKKVSELRLLYQLRNSWLASGEMSLDSLEYKQFSDKLLMIVEHTWGGNGNVFLPDYRNYLIDDFAKARKNKTIEFPKNSYLDFADLMQTISTDIHSKEMAPKRSYELYEQSWQEQRDYLVEAVDCLSPERKQIALEKINKLNQTLPEIDSQQSIIIGKNYQLTNEVIVAFAPNGGISRLKVKERELIASGTEFGGLSYERFDFGNYQTYLSQYSRLTQHTASWALVDFNKRGIEAYQSIRYELIKPTVKDSSISFMEDLVTVEFDLEYTEEQVKQFGLPKSNRLQYHFDLTNNEIKGTYQWRQKQANRMPEGYWLETTITTNNPYRWEMEKLGEFQSPYNVVAKGNRNLHALSEEGMRYRGSDGQLSIKSPTAPLFSFGRRGLLKFDQKQLSLNNGIFINLYNNVWGTNFPDWFEDDMTFKFSLAYDIY